MNFFFALPLPSEVQQEIRRFTEQWQAMIDPALSFQWYAPEDYHITLKFLGDIKETERQKYAELITAAEQITSPCFSLQLTQAGAFSTLHQPQVLILHAMNSQELEMLAIKVDVITTALGFAGETRRYQPHVTLARCRTGWGNQAESLPLAGEHMFPNWRANQFALMQTLPPQSRTNHGDTRYNIVQTFPFDSLSERLTTGA